MRHCFNPIQCTVYLTSTWLALSHHRQIIKSALTSKPKLSAPLRTGQQ